MNKRFEKTFPGPTHVAHGVAFSSYSDNARDPSLECDGDRGPEFLLTPRLPPTRAARVPRSRGTFLDGVRSAHPKWRHLVGASLKPVPLAIACILLALLAYSPSIVTGVALSHNPGPGIVASASVPPAFVIPAKRR